MTSEELRSKLNQVRFEHDVYSKEYQKWHKEMGEKEKEYRKKLDNFIFEEMDLLNELSKLE